MKLLFTYLNIFEITSKVAQSNQTTQNRTSDFVVVDVL